MNKNWVLTQDAFDALLAWLHPSRESAGQKYEDIRRRLIKIFSCRGCNESEDLADETINRVANKLEEIAPTFVGEPARYFYGVANKIYFEYLRRKPMPELPIPTADTDDFEKEVECLERCIQRLTLENRNLVLYYYQDEKRAKIDNRKKLAEQMGIAVNALRIRAYRIRASLQDCVTSCLQEATA
jgi:DNA-directed RNA polymerase specialized sigma24 family protein